MSRTDDSIADLLRKETIMNIYEKMAAITAELQTVAKNLTVATSKTASYKAVSERDILDAVKPLEKKHGVYSYPVSREVIESNLLESESTYNGAVTKKTTFMTRIKTVYRFVNIEKPDEYIETTTFAEGIDSQDKGSGKAMTYGDKYALMKAYKISTGDDPDQTASEDVNYKRAATTKQKKAASATTKSPRELLIAKLHEKGIDPKVYASSKGLTTATTAERYNELLAELEG
jgi:hypothetical protein